MKHDKTKARQSEAANKKTMQERKKGTTQQQNDERKTTRSNAAHDNIVKQGRTEAFAKEETRNHRLARAEAN